MKSFTDLNQSKKLVKILPLESADGYWDFQIDGYNLIADKLGYYKNDSEIPCWSLAALLSVLPEPSLIQNQEGKWLVRSWDRKRFPWSVGGYNNAIDACVAMIERLHEQKLL